MKKYALFLILAVSAIRMDADPAPPTPGDGELHAAASKAPVEKISLSLLGGAVAIQKILEDRFFSLPVVKERLLVTEGWRKEWDIYADALVRSAKSQGLDFGSLDACLNSLHQGRNNQTMLVPFLQAPLLSPNASKQQIREAEDKARGEFDRAMMERKEYPEKYEDERLAVVPIAAFLAEIKEKRCWILVCKYGYENPGESALLGGVMIWVLDSRTRSVVEFSSSD